MKLLIPSYGRAGRVTTPAALDVNADIIIGVHSDADYESYVTAQPELEPFLVVTYASTGPLGANAQRAVLARNFLDDGEWACFADDNITALVGVERTLYSAYEALPTNDLAWAKTCGAKNWHDLYKHAVSRERFDAMCEDMMLRATTRGFHACGFATNSSPLFRPKKWKMTGYCSSKLMLWRNEEDWPWDEMVHMDDFNYSAEQHLRHGGVLINHWCYPVAQHYAAGGLGPYDQRVSHRQESVRLLMERYPGLLRVKDRPGFAPNTELTFRLHSPRQVAAWRRSMLGS